MPVLKSLQFTTVQKVAGNPTLVRRVRLIDRLQEQKRLLADPAYSRTVERWVQTPDGKTKQQKQQRVRPWWGTDPSGKLVLAVYYGGQPIEFEKGRAGIAIPSEDKLPSVIDALIGAVREGELDAFLTKQTVPMGAAQKARAGAATAPAR